MEMNRRHVFKSIGAIGLAAASARSTSANSEQAGVKDETVKDAAKLMATMRAIHGGEWRVDINHAAKMVVVIQI